MKKIIYAFIFIIIFTLVGCNNTNNIKTVSNINNNKTEIYSSDDSEKVKDLLKSYGKSKELTVKKVRNKEIVVVKNEKIVANKKLWSDFYNNSKNKKEDSMIVLQYTPQNDPILTYVSYKDDKYFMMEDDSRDEYRESSKEKDYYEYTFKYLKIFEENKKTYVYLLDDDTVTLEKLNYSLLSSNTDDWISYGFVFYYRK